MPGVPDYLDLDALPPDVRAVIEAERQARAKLEAEVAALNEQNQRLEHLVREFRQALHGKRSEKLGADEWQLAFEGEPLERHWSERQWRARRRWRRSRRRQWPARHHPRRAARRARPGAISAGCPRNCRGSNR